ncbi:serine/threonine-protein kinase [Tsukamurella sp. 8F]|uniref:serine/threonine-protein kinase n=1 Tax=unclassified Tsukamurella TaxID=2633480 RepID=UPI0023B8CEF8|nr:MULTISPECIES: serine/threonine-protein kinase [unclassified Tsukamurella]MDF0531391.1 serine/threonine-protein kinase [Tsukamurella sp. 8J]MDF0585303.1 serine/threonine-protein kinase [Tsukamurella sp. 8F]
MTPHAQTPDRTIAGYHVLRRLGSGGMGEVFLVQHPRLPRRDALKLLDAGVSRNQDFAGRFQREADLLAPLSHQNIVHLYDRGVVDGRLWLTMEYVDGKDAHHLLAENGPMPLDLAADIAAGVGAGLDYAYQRRGITHRDVKPANILVELRHGRVEAVKLADFGIAKAAGEATSLTSTGVTIGTVGYMSPEAIEGRPLDNRADVYSLACTVFEMLTGSLPFTDDTMTALISAHLTRAVPPITKRAPGLPTYLNNVFRKALAKDPADRFGTCAEFVAALRGQAAVDEPPRTAAGTAQSALAPPGTAALPSHTRAMAPPVREYPPEASARHDLHAGQTRAEPAPRRRRGPYLAAAAGALVVVVALIVGLTLWKGNGTSGTGGASGHGSGGAVTATSVSLVDFSRNPDSSNRIDNVLTGESPAWKTANYASGPKFGNLKDGIGLLFTLSGSETVTGGMITSPSAGSTVEVRTASSSSLSSLDGTSTVWSGTLSDGDTPFTASGASATKYVLVWITGLAGSGRNWQTAIAHVTFTGRS